MRAFKTWLLAILFRDAAVVASATARRAIERSLKRELHMPTSTAKQAAGCAVRALQRAGFTRHIEPKERSP